MDVVFIDRPVYGRLDNISMALVSQVLKHVHGSTQHGHWVGNVLSSDGSASVPGARLENGVLQVPTISTELNKKLCSLRDRRSFCPR